MLCGAVIRCNPQRRQQLPGDRGRNRKQDPDDKSRYTSREEAQLEELELGAAGAAIAAIAAGPASAVPAAGAAPAPATAAAAATAAAPPPGAGAAPAAVAQAGARARRALSACGRGVSALPCAHSRAHSREAHPESVAWPAWAAALPGDIFFTTFPSR